ncbi:GAF domain-containing protein [Actinoallomurus iriomotensis]|nr:GAF domain-containing protein [Actinoallomurus iriomotensis]
MSARSRAHLDRTRMLGYVPEQHDFFTDALAEITGLLVSGERGEAVLQLIDEASMRVLGVAAVGMLVIDPRGGIEVVAASDEQARFVELLQSQVDEGPCRDCIHANEVINVPDLASARNRWPTFAPAALAAGFRAVHALPLRLGGRSVGGLNLLHTGELWLTELQQRLAQTFADLAVLGLSQERDAARRMERLAEETLGALNDRAMMGQAVGLVAGTLDIRPEQARMMIGLYARRNARSARDLAQAVIDGRLDLADLTVAASETS